VKTDSTVLAEAVRILLNEATRTEQAHVLGAAEYERSDKRRGYANGFKAKTVETRLGAITVQVPQVRGDVEFYPSALERGVRSERALKLAVAEMYVQGVSTRKVTEVMKQLCGLEVSSKQVSRATKLLDDELTAWRKRPLGKCNTCCLMRAMRKVRQAGAVLSCAVLLAVGITKDGRRSVLGASISLSEAEVHWREFLASLQERGMHGVELVISDNHAGLKAARETRLPGVCWQRCQFHVSSAQFSNSGTCDRGDHAATGGAGRREPSAAVCVRIVCELRRSGSNSAALTRTLGGPMYNHGNIMQYSKQLVTSR
jgi:putative transposase